MIERRVGSFEFFSSLDSVVDRLFLAQGKGLGEILILTKDDGTETEAIVPIEEYRRLKRLTSRGQC